MTYRVEFSTAAETDLKRLFDFFLKRELESASGDLDLHERALRAIKDGVAFLRHITICLSQGGVESFRA
jgi:hypothetical protein